MTNQDMLEQARAAAPAELRLADPARLIEEGAAWLRAYLETSGQAGYVLGLSGGIDSATVALWAARAVGGRRLRLYALPYGDPFAAAAGPPLLDRSSRDSVEDARLVAAAVPDAHYQELDIRPAVDAVLEATGLAAALRAGTADAAVRLGAANAKARIRATMLRTLANAHRSLLLGTENRTEHLLGYFTIGGDEESDLELLPSFLKAEVRQLYAALGGPREVLEKPPTADLWAGQTDEGELGFTYPQADFVLHYADAAGGDAHAAPDEREVVARIRAGEPSRGGATDPALIDTVPAVLAQLRRTAYKRADKPTFAPAGRAAH